MHWRGFIASVPSRARLRGSSSYESAPYYPTSSPNRSKFGFRIEGEIRVLSFLRFSVFFSYFFGFIMLLGVSEVFMSYSGSVVVFVHNEFKKIMSFWLYFVAGAKFYELFHAYWVLVCVYFVILTIFLGCSVSDF
jgi:hypothetical protein